LATFKEQGLDWSLDAFFVLYASKNIDPAMLANLRKQIAHILQTNTKSYQQLGLTMQNSHNLDIEQFHRDMSTKYQTIKLPTKE
jgi:arsenate reductase-like glutaredoxin family protein